MTDFSKRDDRLGRKLRAERPAPSDALVTRIEGRVRSERMVTRRSFRVALPAAFTAVVLGGLAAVGGVSYAASSVASVARTVSHVFVPTNAQRTVVVQGLSSGGDQYKPGFGWGDPNHTHTGPPGLTEGNGSSGGAFAPPLTPKISGKTAFVTSSIKLDEQAHLYISVVNTTTGKELLITQKKSNINGGLNGKQAKNVNYLVLVPRTIPLKLAIPANLLASGGKFQIRVIAQSPTGDKKTLLIPFTS
jgi:hypothetical protein